MPAGIYTVQGMKAANANGVITALYKLVAERIDVDTMAAPGGAALFYIRSITIALAPPPPLQIPAAP
jgi:hypothetical protein